MRRIRAKTSFVRSPWNVRAADRFTAQIGVSAQIGNLSPVPNAALER
jgi:hypothetical protein